FDRQVVAEGQNPAAVGTVTRNTAPGSALQVNLTSSNTNELTVPLSVTIPANASSVQFNAASVDDGETDGNKPVTVSASAAGFTSGNAQISVTDVNLPDLLVSSITVPASAETETFVSLNWQVANQGLVNATSNTIVQRVWL